jgi:hypothetical protein
MGLIPLMIPAVYGAVFLGRMKEKGLGVLAGVLLALAVLLAGFQVGSSIRGQKLLPPVTDDLVVPPGLKAAVDMYTTPDDPLLLMYSPHYHAVLDRPHSFVWSQMIDEMLRVYDGVDDADKFARIRVAIEQKMPRIIFLESTYLIPRQQKHLKALIIPFIRKHRYTQVSPGVFVLLPVIKWEDTRSVPKSL